MVGGTIIEKSAHRLSDGNVAVRYWVVDGVDELAVLAEPASIEPQVGDSIWWQAGRIYFDGDRRSLRKIAYSYDPRRALEGGE